VDDATHETWRPIPGYDGAYEVSDLGRVRSYRLYHGTSQRLLSPGLSHGYLQVTLIRDGKRSIRRVHQLVMLAFVGPRPAGQEVRHGPLGKLDNRLISLCYGTRTENIADRVRDGGQRYRGLGGEENGRAKLTAADAAEIRRLVAAGEMQVSVARRFGVGKSTISRVICGQCWPDGTVQ